MKKYFYTIIAVFLVVLVSCGNNDRELKEIVRKMNSKTDIREFLRTWYESSPGMTDDLIDFEKVEYDGHKVTLTYSFAEGVLNYDSVRANENSFRDDILVGYAYSPYKGLKMMIDAIVKAGADLIVVFNCENQDAISICFTAEELKNNLTNADANPIVLLKTMAANARLQTPVVVEEGVVMTDVLLEEHYYTYVYECDESGFDIIDIMEESKTEMKEVIMEDVLGGNDSMTKAVCDLLKKVHYGLAFKYVGSTSGKICTVYIEPSEF